MKTVHIIVDKNQLGDIPFLTFEKYFLSELRRWSCNNTKFLIDLGNKSYIIYEDRNQIPMDEMIQQCSEKAYQRAVNREQGVKS